MKKIIMIVLLWVVLWSNSTTVKWLPLRLLFCMNQNVTTVSQKTDSFLRQNLKKKKKKIVPNSILTRESITWWNSTTLSHIWTLLTSRALPAVLTWLKPLIYVGSRVVGAAVALLRYRQISSQHVSSSHLAVIFSKQATSFCQVQFSPICFSPGCGLPTLLLLPALSLFAHCSKISTYFKKQKKLECIYIVYWY